MQVRISGCARWSCRSVHFSPHVAIRISSKQYIRVARKITPKHARTWTPVISPTAVQRTAVAADVPDPENFPSQALSNFSPGQARKASTKLAPASYQKLILALLQLFAVVALLIVWPAWLFCKCIPVRVWYITTVYLSFFGFGGLRRTLLHGKLSSRKQDAQVATQQGKWAIAVFVVLIVAGENSLSCLSFTPLPPFFAHTCYCCAVSVRVSAAMSCHTRQILCRAPGHWESVRWFGTCFRKIGRDPILDSTFSSPAVQYVSVLLLTAAIALHTWATQTLGKVCVNYSLS